MIVLDTNSYSSVFDQNSSDHADFCHVMQWVNSQKRACFVYGGKKYKDEMRNMVKYLDLIDELKKAGKFVEINGRMIDEDAARLKNICTDVAFNDEHIVAILNISGCKLVCTKDTSAMPYIKRKDFYSDKKRPQIYSGARSKNVLKSIYQDRRKTPAFFF
ncbi:MAG: hypothetical protein LBG73_03215 [Spirochaetaceae bacterium]|jgi:hypothetical protein|nr:hypothetical protein [Spirochaetaceae bacterium]